MVLHGAGSGEEWESPCVRAWVRLRCAPETGGRGGGGSYWHCPVGRINVLRAVALARHFCAATAITPGRD